MIKQRPTDPQRDTRARHRRIAMISAATLGLLLVAGVGTASAGERRWWHRSHHTPGGSPSASASRGGWASQPVPSPSIPASAQPPAASTRPSAPVSGTPTGSGPKGVAVPPANGQFDYQIGGSYSPPSGVTVVSRDRGDSPAAGRYNICYVNGFQTQPDEISWWKSNHDDLLLKRNGSYVEDSAWDELLLDVSTSAKREALATIVGGWIDGCASKGFNAVEVDNLDSWTRSNGTLTESNAVEYAKLLASRAHAKGLAIAQKNTSELANKGKTVIGFDFAIAEQCAEYTTDGGRLECQSYVNVYGDHVIVIEYASGSFDKACKSYGSTLSIVLRDRDVTPGGVYRSC
jgi:hypothetical protein